MLRRKVCRIGGRRLWAGTRTCRNAHSSRIADFQTLPFWALHLSEAKPPATPWVIAARGFVGLDMAFTTDDGLMLSASTAAGHDTAQAFSGSTRARKSGVLILGLTMDRAVEYSRALFRGENRRSVFVIG